MCDRCTSGTCGVNGAMLRRDARNINLEIPEKATNLKADRASVLLKISVSQELRAARCVWAEFVIYNKMFGTTEEKSLMFQMSEKEECFEIPIESKACGEVSIHCVRACVVDLET